jgi:tRNA threonylcarbamoyladenosine biosynthesis protein TsaB
VNILAVDTTSEFASLAVRADGKIAAEVMMHSTAGFAHLLFSAIEDVLSKAGVQLKQVDCFASASGPGAFTGVRVGLSAVKGLAEAAGKAAAAVSNLRAIATYGSADRRAVVLDARRGEVFGAVYDPQLEPVAPEVVSKLSDWLESLDNGEYEFISSAGSPFAVELAQTKFAGMRFTEAPRHLAQAIAYCAESDGVRGKWNDPAALDANYVRRSDAELFWKE